jgi:hypothetical protein
LPKTDQRRARLASEIQKLSEAMMVLAGRIKWTLRDVIDGRAREADALPESSAHELFTLAQDVASGRVELDGPDSPRPLFDRSTAEDRADVMAARAAMCQPGTVSLEELKAELGLASPPAPAKPDPLDATSSGALAALEGLPPRAAPPGDGSLCKGHGEGPEIGKMPPGTRLFACNRCNLLRLRTVAICPDCGSPEYRLRVADDQGWPVRDEEFLAATEPPPRTARKPPQKTFRLVYRTDDADEAIDCGTFRAANFDEARSRIPELCRHESVRLASGSVVPMNLARVEAVQVPAVPRKRKEAIY